MRAGGTWLGLNEFGLVAGLLSRRPAEESNQNARSRGMLCLDALRRSTAADAALFAGAERGCDYNPFNLLMASREEAYVAYNRGSHIQVVSLTPGLHLLTNLDVDDFECPKISRAYDRFAELAERTGFRDNPLGAQAALGTLLADHSTQLDSRTGRPNSLCLHLYDYGTRSSSMIFLGKRGEVCHRFAAGAPCAAPYEAAIVPRVARSSSFHGEK